MLRAMLSSPPGDTALHRAVALLGSQGKLARAAKLTQGCISQALKRGRVSAETAIAIEAATGGQENTSRHDLRPDLFNA